mgnify:CR=1 FL=1
MTNENASRANREVMTSDEMEVEAHVVGGLIDAAMAVCVSRNHENLYDLLEMAHERVQTLESALNRVSWRRQDNER